MELIKLTGQELAVDRLGVTMTLKEIADKFKIKHSNLMKQFEKDLNSLDEKRLPQIGFRKTTFEVITGNNTKKTYDTYELGIKEVVWVISRFKADLRLQVINYAFSKLEEDYYQLELKTNKLEKDFNRVNKELADKLFGETVIDDTTYMSVSKAKRILNTEHTVNEIFDLLEEAGDIETEVIKTKKRKLTSFNGKLDSAGNPRFQLGYIRQLIERDLSY